MIKNYFEKGITPESIKGDVIEYVNKEISCVQRWIALNRCFPTWEYCPKVSPNPYLAKDLKRAEARLGELEKLLFDGTEEEQKDWLDQHKEKNIINFFQPQGEFPGKKEMFDIQIKLLDLAERLDPQGDPLLVNIKDDIKREIEKCGKSYCSDRQEQSSGSTQEQLIERIRQCKISIERKKQAILDDGKQVDIDNKQLELLFNFINKIS